MKILFLSWGILPQKTGGLEKATYYYFKYLDNKNNTVYLFIPNLTKDVYNFWSNKLVNSKIFGLNIDTFKSYIDYFRYESFTLYKKNLVDYRSAVNEYKNRLIDFLKNNKLDFDIIYAYDWLTTPAAIELKKIYKKPLIIHFHSLAYDRVGANPDLLKYLYDYDYGIEIEGCRNADYVITVSKREKEILEKYYFCNGNKINVIYNAPDEDFKLKEKIRSKINDKYKIVLFLGRITLHKGPDYLLRAAKKVLEKNKNVLFIFAGTGEMLDQLIKLAAELKISKNVIFTGWIDDELAEYLYSISDIFVLPSISEPFGLTPFEALQYKDYIILSKQAGVAEVLKSALKIDFWDVDKLANYILALLEYRVLGDYELKLCLDDIKNISWEDSVNVLLSIFDKVININRS
ncbi:D-inositol-3-phosphate glycosyltransferase [Nanobdella aerobiophila]|uniref:D-inositol-3-phosphate glycosyltransferase n=1 Tax=Nanobdella aerobiophila TaxID=2586965 RepID=A0A915WR79_9ARCH|nr:glycosyltransferase family 4 protein [Nanobdella aerobiophila]BBL45258.1 D-inositol-3-phosphate glycosyltransferase [Nanobdella aerobiophila]